MARVPVPMDLSRIKPKVFLNLTLRQIICFGSGALIGVPLFLLLTKASIRSAAFFLDTEKTDCCILPLFLSIPLELLF